MFSDSYRLHMYEDYVITVPNGQGLQRSCCSWLKLTLSTVLREHWRTAHQQPDAMLNHVHQTKYCLSLLFTFWNQTLNTVSCFVFLSNGLSCMHLWMQRKSSDHHQYIIFPFLNDCTRSLPSSLWEPTLSNTKPLRMVVWPVRTPTTMREPFESTNEISFKN